MLAIEVYLKAKQKEDIKNTCGISFKDENVGSKSLMDLRLKEKEELTNTAINIGNNIRLRKSISMFKYKLNKKLNYVYTFLLHCVSLFSIGLFAKYTLSEEIVYIDID